MKIDKTHGIWLNNAKLIDDVAYMLFVNTFILNDNSDLTFPSQGIFINSIYAKYAKSL